MKNYGKGNALHSYCGSRSDFSTAILSSRASIPGTRIPILLPEKIAEIKPDYVMILPWDLKENITTQLAYIRGWDGESVVPIPELSVF